MGLMEEEPNSMLYWLPKLRKMDVRIPTTVIVKAEMFPDDEDGNVLIGYNEDHVEEDADKLGYPVFIRTDKASAKHDFEDISKVKEEDNIHGKIHMLADDNLSKGVFGIEFNAIVIREWLDIKHEFKAFHGNLPVGYEIRAFIRDGEIECKHYYWIKDAIEKSSFKPENWEEKWKKAKRETMKRWDEVEDTVLQIAQEFDGWWSVDLALTEEGKWYVIDMAKGEDSFHPPSCKYSPMRVENNESNK